MKQLDLFEESKPKYWTPFPGLVGIYYQTEEDKQRMTLSYKEWKEANPEAAAKQERILEELREKVLASTKPKLSLFEQRKLNPIPKRDAAGFF